MAPLTVRVWWVETKRFALFWVLSVAATAVCVSLVVSGMMLWDAPEIGTDLPFVPRFVQISLVWGAAPFIVVLWLPAWFVFALVMALLERLGQQSAATIAAGVVALFVAGVGSTVFGGLVYFGGFAGLVIGPVIAWRVWRDA